jgi:hypothetical protein
MITARIVEHFLHIVFAFLEYIKAAVLFKLFLAGKTRRMKLLS